MAFKLENLTPIANNAKSGICPALWMYWNEAGDTVTTAGYVSPHAGVKAKDQVIVVSANGQTSTTYYATVSDGVVTLAS